MPGSKVYASADAAVAEIRDGATVMVSGYGEAGVPRSLVRSLMDRGAIDLTCVCGPIYGSGLDGSGAAALLSAGLVSRLVTSHPLPVWPDKGMAGLEVDLVPQGLLAERIRAGGAGIGGLFVPRDQVTSLEGRETKVIDGVECVLLGPLKADFALLRARVADTLGNLEYWRSQRNWGPLMAMAAHVTIAEVDEVVEPGDIDPELVITPGIYVNRIVKV